MSQLPLSATGLRKAYQQHVVLDGVDLEVRGGEVVALRGPNGAGKSTLLGCVVGDVVPDAGETLIDGVALRTQPVEARRRFRYLAQQSDPPPGLTGEEMLAFWQGVYQAPSIDEARELCGLGDALSRLTTTYSVGMRRRLGFAVLAMGKAPLYILDEPFAGVDAEGRERMCNWLAARKAAGAGLLLAAHDSDEPELQRLEARTVQVGGR